MAEATIPVDPFNPGQVFACVGFLEAAEILLGEAEGGFAWDDASADVTFAVRAAGDANPVEAVLAFLAEAEVVVDAPTGNAGPWPDGAQQTEAFPAPLGSLRKSNSEGFSASVLPIRLKRGVDEVPITHWLERDKRATMKLFAGQQVGAVLTQNMLAGDEKKKASRGLRDILSDIADQEFSDPFETTCPVGGRFGFDARGSWDAMRIGSSLDQQGTLVEVSPHVEMLAAIGLENTRPLVPTTYRCRYAIWSGVYPVMLGRVGLFAPESFVPRGEYRYFGTHLGDDKQYKKLFFATEETAR